MPRYNLNPKLAQMSQLQQFFGQDEGLDTMLRGLASIAGIQHDQAVLPGQLKSQDLNNQHLAQLMSFFPQQQQRESDAAAASLRHQGIIDAALPGSLAADTKARELANTTAASRIPYLDLFNQNEANLGQANADIAGQEASYLPTKHEQQTRKNEADIAHEYAVQNLLGAQTDNTGAQTDIYKAKLPHVAADEQSTIRYHNAQALLNELAAAQGANSLFPKNPEVGQSILGGDHADLLRVLHGMDLKKQVGDRAALRDALQKNPGLLADPAFSSAVKNTMPDEWDLYLDNLRNMPNSRTGLRPNNSAPVRTGY